MSTREAAGRGIMSFAADPASKALDEGPSAS
jgi:hypothetical protein